MHFFDFPANFIIGAPYLHPGHGNFMHLLLRCASVCDYATPYVAFVSGPKQFEHNGHHYWFSGKEENFTDHKVDWLDGRNICREYCMDLVSLETPSENDLISKYLTDNDLPYIWTSGRLCNFKGCDREDLQPTNVNGWFWSGSGVKMAPTNSTPPGWSYQPWSYTGHKTQFEGKNVSQPDNAEFDINGSTEACMGLLNDIYDDGVKWHDIACYHTKPFICEDSEQLLEYIQLIAP